MLGDVKIKLGEACSSSVLPKEQRILTFAMQSVRLGAGALGAPLPKRRFMVSQKLTKNYESHTSLTKN